jgi:hypothetical protein
MISVEDHSPYRMELRQHFQATPRSSMYESPSRLRVSTIGQLLAHPEEVASMSSSGPVLARLFSPAARQTAG